MFAALQEIDTTAFVRESRVYGGGLHKLEPNELARIAAASVVKALPELDGVQQGELFRDG